MAAPTRISMPGVQIDTPLVPLSVGPDNVLQPPPFGVAGWWQGGPEPGEPGPAVLAGHVDSDTGPDTFYHLSAVQPGQQVVVEREDGSSVRFTVTSIERVPRDAFPTKRVYGLTAAPTIRLITCGGPYDRVAGAYEENVVVFGTIAN